MPAFLKQQFSTCGSPKTSRKQIIYVTIYNNSKITVMKSFYVGSPQHEELYIEGSQHLEG